MRRAVGKVARYHRALEAGRLRRVDMQRDSVLAQRRNATRMQHLGPIAGDFLRLVVMQRAQQPRTRHIARIRTEHARNIGPDLQAQRSQFGREVSARRVGAAAPEHNGVAVLVGGDEALRDDDPLHGAPARLQPGIGRKIAGRGQQFGPWRGIVPAPRAQDLPRIDPGGGYALRVQELRAQGGGEQFAHRHDARPQPIAELCTAGKCRGNLRQLAKERLKLRPRSNR